MPGKRANGEGCITLRSDGRWMARATTGRDPGTGKPTYRYFYGKTQAEVRKKLTASAHELDEGIFTDPVKLTVGGWMDIWAKEYLSSVKINTVHQYAYQIRVHIKPALGAVRLVDLKPPMIQKMYNDAGRKGLSPKSVKNLHGVMHKAMAQAVDLGYIRFNPCGPCKLPRVERKEMHPLEGAHLQEFVEACRGSKYGDLYFITTFTGMRQGEVLGLTWDCVDFTRGTLTLYRQLQKSREKGKAYAFMPPKNDKRRTLTIAPAVLERLREVQRKQKEARIKAGGAWDNPEKFIFTNELGGHLCTDSVYGCFKRIVKHLGIGETRFHDLRHTYATLSLQNGDDVKTVSENLGHATVAFTLEIYGHVTAQMRQSSAARMQGFIEGVK